MKITRNTQHEFLQKYLQNDSKINVLAYPAQNPDLKPTENVWAYSKKKKLKERSHLNVEEQGIIIKGAKYVCK